MKRLRQFLKDEEGATAIEYSIIAGTMVLAVVAGTTSIGQTLLGFFTRLLGGFN